MPANVRLNDLCTGHGIFPSRRVIQGSDNVFINGLPAFRIGDKIDCGSRGMTGSDDVFTGDYPQQPEF